jgi:hypothetical protein
MSDSRVPQTVNCNHNEIEFRGQCHSKNDTTEIDILCYAWADGDPINDVFPEQLCQLYNLESIHMTACGLQGPLPECLGNLNKIQSIKFINNKFTGEIPISWYNLPLEYLNLRMNNLSGQLHDEWNFGAYFSTLNHSHNAYFKEFDIKSNNLSGRIPYDQIIKLHRQTDSDYDTVVKYDFSDNNFTGISTDPNLSLDDFYLWWFETLFAGNAESNDGIPSAPKLWFNNNNFTGIISDSVCQPFLDNINWESYTGHKIDELILPGYNSSSTAAGKFYINNFCSLPWCITELFGDQHSGTWYCEDQIAELNQINDPDCETLGLVTCHHGGCETIEELCSPVCPDALPLGTNGYSTAPHNCQDFNDWGNSINLNNNYSGGPTLGTWMDAYLSPYNNCDDVYNSLAEAYNEWWELRCDGPGELCTEQEQKKWICGYDHDSSVPSPSLEHNSGEELPNWPWQIPEVGQDRFYFINFCPKWCNDNIETWSCSDENLTESPPWTCGCVQGQSELDDCNVCDGNNYTHANGTWDCGEDNENCDDVDCAGVCFGNAEIQNWYWDEDGDGLGFGTPIQQCSTWNGGDSWVLEGGDPDPTCAQQYVRDCGGICDGDAFFDSCGFCKCGSNGTYNDESTCDPTEAHVWDENLHDNGGNIGPLVDACGICGGGIWFDDMNHLQCLGSSYNTNPLSFGTCPNYFEDGYFWNNWHDQGICDCSGIYPKKYGDGNFPALVPSIQNPTGYENSLTFTNSVNQQDRFDACGECGGNGIPCDDYDNPYYGDSEGIITGCTDEAACNYNSAATISCNGDNSCCWYAPDHYYCDQSGIYCSEGDIDNDGICDNLDECVGIDNTGEPCVGDNDPIGCNSNYGLTLQLTQCEFLGNTFYVCGSEYNCPEESDLPQEDPGTCTVNDEGGVIGEENNCNDGYFCHVTGFSGESFDGYCLSENMVGCTDPTASNYADYYVPCIGGYHSWIMCEGDGDPYNCCCEYEQLTIEVGECNCEWNVWDDVCQNTEHRCPDGYEPVCTFSNDLIGPDDLIHPLESCNYGNGHAVLSGDVNLNQVVNILDVVTLINHILGQQLITEPCALLAGDTNSDNNHNIQDVIQILQMILSAGNYTSIDGHSPQSVEYFLIKGIIEDLTPSPLTGAPTHSFDFDDFPRPFSPETIKLLRNVVGKIKVYIRRMVVKKFWYEITLPDDLPVILKPKTPYNSRDESIRRDCDCECSLTDECNTRYYDSYETYDLTGDGVIDINDYWYLVRVFNCPLSTNSFFWRSLQQMGWHGHAVPIGGGGVPNPPDCDNPCYSVYCPNICDCPAVDCGEEGSGTIYGCTNPVACNYNPDATASNDSCVFETNWCDCAGNPTEGNASCDCNGNPEGLYCDCEYTIPTMWCMDQTDNDIGDLDNSTFSCFQPNVGSYPWVENCQYCGNGTIGCDGICNSGAYNCGCGCGNNEWCTSEDECIDTDEDGICDCVDSCVGNVWDCLGICDGDAVEDECGVCEGDGSTCCLSGVWDCYGQCDGSHTIDECGECGNWNSITHIKITNTDSTDKSFCHPGFECILLIPEQATSIPIPAGTCSQEGGTYDCLAIEFFHPDFFTPTTVDNLLVRQSPGGLSMILYDFESSSHGWYGDMESHEFILYDGLGIDTGNPGGIPEGECDCNGNILDDCDVCGGYGKTQRICNVDDSLDSDIIILNVCPNEWVSCEDAGYVTPPEGEVYGCLDDTNACNYNEEATIDDGSCFDYLPWCDCDQANLETYEYCDCYGNVNEGYCSCDGTLPTAYCYDANEDGEGGCSNLPDDYEGPCPIISCEDPSSDGWISDCTEDCDGDIDICGVCNGDGIADGTCDCEGNVAAYECCDGTTVCFVSDCTNWPSDTGGCCTLEQLGDCWNEQTYCTAGHITNTCPDDPTCNDECVPYTDVCDGTDWSDGFGATGTNCCVNSCCGDSNVNDENDTGCYLTSSYCDPATSTCCVTDESGNTCWEANCDNNCYAVDQDLTGFGYYELNNAPTCTDLGDGGDGADTDCYDGRDLTPYGYFYYGGTDCDPDTGGDQLCGDIDTYCEVIACGGVCGAADCGNCGTDDCGCADLTDPCACSGCYDVDTCLAYCTTLGGLVSEQEYTFLSYLYTGNTDGWFNLTGEATFTDGTNTWDDLDDWITDTHINSNIISSLDGVVGIVETDVCTAAWCKDDTEHAAYNLMDEISYPTIDILAGLGTKNLVSYPMEEAFDPTSCNFFEVLEASLSSGSFTNGDQVYYTGTFGDYLAQYSGGSWSVGTVPFTNGTVQRGFGFVLKMASTATINWTTEGVSCV